MHNPHDQLEQLIESYRPNHLNDEFSRICYKVFIDSEDGRTLMGYLFDLYVHHIFTDILDQNASIETNTIIAKSVRKDFIQSLLLRAQSYEKELQTNGKLNDGTFRTSYDGANSSS